MREKILSLAKGNFIYETPKLCLSIEKLVFEVTAGTHGTASFLLENSFGTRVKGFGTVEEMCIDFLPFFDGTKNELTVDVDAGELNPGEKLKGNLDLITDCGEEKLPYEITIVSPVLRDEEGEIRDYPTLKKRIEKNPESRGPAFGTAAHALRRRERNPGSFQQAEKVIQVDEQISGHLGIFEFPCKELPQQRKRLHFHLPVGG